MAIQIDVEQSQFGIPFNGAYYRIFGAGIERIDDPQNRHRLVMDVLGYAAQPVDERVREIDSRRYFAPLLEIDSMEGSGFLAKCYAWLMSHPDFADAAPV